MLHDGNKIYGDKESENSIKEISEFLVKFSDDGDENALWCKFNRLIGRVHDQELSHRATWNAYLGKALRCYLKELEFTFKDSSEEITESIAAVPFGIYIISVENDDEGKKIYNCSIAYDGDRDCEIAIASVDSMQTAMSYCEDHYMNKMKQFIKMENGYTFIEYKKNITKIER